MEIDLLNIVLRILTGAMVGFCIGMTGIGGGAIVVPTLTLGFGLPPSISVGTANLYTFLTKIYATYRHARLKTINYRVSWIFLAGAVPGSIAASWYINHRAGSVVGEGLNVQFQGNLKLFIAAVILASGGILLLNLIITRKQMSNNPNPIRTPPQHTARTMLGIAMGPIVGATVGATALGTGIMAIPILLFCFGIYTSQGIGSSIFIGLVLTLISSLIYGKGGQIHIPTALLMSLGSLVGVYYGSKLMVKLPETKLKLVVIGIILIASILMFFR